MSMVVSGAVYSGLIVAKDATGALSTPIVGPVGALYVNGTVNAASVTITGSNPYKWSVILPTLSAGDIVSLYITATIATIATAAVVAEASADTAYVSSRSTYAGGAVASVTAGVTLASGEHTNIAADAQTGMTAQGYTTTRAGYLDTLNTIGATVWTYITRTLTGITIAAVALHLAVRNLFMALPPKA
jgi:hypothetical protein